MPKNLRVTEFRKSFNFIRSIVLLCLFSLPSGTISASILDVPAEFSTIGNAIASAGFGDIVMVAPGTYIETINIGPTDDGIIVMGAGPDLSIIDGSGGGASPPLVTISGVTNATIFEGFTIVGNTSEGDGGGVVIQDGGGIFRNNKILTNLAQFGGGMFVSNATAILEGNIFEDNHGTRGNGLYILGGEPVLRNNIFHDNLGSQVGGAIYVKDSLVEITGNTIDGNRTSNNSNPPVRGGGIYVECTDSLSSVPVISGNSITGNGFGTGTNGEGPAVYVETDCLSENVFFGHNNVWNNSIPGQSIPQLNGLLDDSILNSLVYTNIVEDPQYVNTSLLDFQLRPNSPLRDQGFLFPEFGCMVLGFGDPCVLLESPAITDFDGILRPQSGSVPGPVKFLRADPDILNGIKWNNLNGVTIPVYNIYRGLLSEISTTNYGECHLELDSLSNTHFDFLYDETEDPQIGDSFFFVVTGEDLASCQLDIGAYEMNGESPFGNDSDSNPRPNLNSCQITCEGYF